MAEFYDVIIIGAGLSGLHSAWKCQQKQKKVLVLEARQRIGGRIFSPKQCDLGPTWLWPQMQPRLKTLTEELNLKVISQYTQGDQIYQFSTDRSERFNDVSPHAQSYRIDGGVGSISDALMSQLNSNMIKLDAQVNGIQKTSNGVEVSINKGQECFSAKQIILALPPRVALQQISFSPELDKNITQSLNELSTWMATQAKMVFVYSNAFWRVKGLSGEAMSQHGPLREISDACNEEGTFNALSAFMGVNAHQRNMIEQQQLIDASLKQLQGFFGDDALTPLDVFYKDWSQESLTCSTIDLTSPPQHPHYPANLSRETWQGKLILSGSELAAEHGGYLEGAVESSNIAIELIKEALVKPSSAP